MTKKLTAIILTLLLTFSVLPLAFATGTPTITVSSATAAPGETVNVKVSLSNNPGINTFALGFDYDTTRLSLLDVTLADGAEGSLTYVQKAIWIKTTKTNGSYDTTYNGDYLNLEFKILDNAADGDASVAVTYIQGDISNEDEDDVDFALQAGKVTVQSSTQPSGVITVSSATAAPGETVNLKVSLSNNPGINTFSLGFDYDTTRLSLLDVTLADGAEGSLTYVQKAIWIKTTKTNGSYDTTYNGDYLNLEFKVLDNAAAGDASVAVTYSQGDISNENEVDVDFSLVPGKVTVQNPPIGDYDAKAALDSVTGRPGDTVCIGVSLDRELDVKSMAISDFSYDNAKLSLTGGEWKVNGAILSDWRQNDEVGAVAFRENTKLQGTVFLLSFKIMDNLDDCEIPVECQLQIKSLNASGAEEQLRIQSVPGSIAVINILRGDVNGDDFVNSNDAIHLLYHTLLPDRYTINQSGDFDGDGYVNSNDAIYLLYFTLLPERYPLY